MAELESGDIEAAWGCLKSSVANEWTNHQEPDEISLATIALNMEQAVLIYSTRTEDWYDAKNKTILAEFSYRIPIRNIDLSTISFEAVHLRLWMQPQSELIACTQKMPAPEKQTEEDNVLIRLDDSFFALRPTDEKVLLLLKQVEKFVTYFQGQRL